MLQGVKLKQAKAGETRPREQLPITPAIMRLVKGVGEAEGGETEQHHAVGGVLHRPRWFPTVRRGDVRLGTGSPPALGQVGIKASKSVPFRRGVFVYRGIENRVRSGPGQAVAAYMQGRGREKGAVFTFTSGTPSSRDKLVWCLRAALCKAGIEAEKYAGRSLRIGAATICSINKYGRTR